jgi:O-succinylbenzoate synthase
MRRDKPGGSLFTMQIDSVEIFRLALPLAKRLSSGTDDRLETVLVLMQSGDASGWGEASPGNAPRDCEEWAAGAFAILKDWLAPAVAGNRIESGEALEKLLAPFRGNRRAKAALDTAWWDLNAKLLNEPLHELLGGKKSELEVGLTFDRMDSIEEFFSSLGRAFDDGYARLKLMFRPGWDIRMLEAVRREFPSKKFHIDAAGALSIHHSEILYRLDDFALAMVEQPLAEDDFVGHAMLQEAIRTPICLGRSIRTLAHAEMAMELHNCRFVALDVGRVGGLTAALAIHDVCHESCTPCFVDAVPQTTIAARHAFALAAKDNCGEYPAEYFPAEEFMAADVAQPLLPIRGEDGIRRIRLDASPGIGVEPDRQVIEKYCLERVKLP